MLIIPAIDLQQGKCVRLEQGRKQAATVYDSEPVALAQRFESAGARMIHVVDLDGAFGDASPNRQVLREIVRAVSIPIQFGGGLRHGRAVQDVIDLGVSRAVIGTLAVESPQELAALLLRHGGDRIVVAIDAKDGEVMVRGWEHQGKVFAVELARAVARAGVERIVYTDVSRDGMLTGPNLELTALVARESGLKVTASGGVSSLNDLEQLKTLDVFGVDSVIVGKAIYEGRFTLTEALEAVRGPETL
jgi:phosphoribosylformimino-5-aminoimidazole carboxamide ribotide isomerase